MPLHYKRRPTVTVNVGNVAIGGDNPVVVQSMTSTSTMDTRASIDQIRDIADAGGLIVRLTAQGVREAANLAEIHAGLRASGYTTPLVADIHFNPAAAFEAARHVEKVRINPGNFIDPGRTFKHLDYTDAEYADELARLADAFRPLLDLCREKGTALRIGVNHGSLSDRIMSRYGDTPAGMTESAMEFLRVCRDEKFDNVVISIKASTVPVMVETVRLLVSAMDAEGMHYPLHLGVTEAGDGEDGRVKSAVGIGSLLADGIGDTIRVSLSEHPAAEIPVARLITAYADRRAKAPAVDGTPQAPVRHIARPLVASTAPVSTGDSPDIVLGDDYDTAFVDAVDIIGGAPVPDAATIVLTSSHPDFIGSMTVAMGHIARKAPGAVVIMKSTAGGATDADTATVNAAIDLGSLLLNGYGDGIVIDSPALSADDAVRLAFGILQATRLRISHTEFISCPGCGRTLFDLQSVVRDVKAATAHLKGLKIGIMGCIVNGPGEMADADYGYVGAAAGKISLYKGKQLVERNIPQSEAIDRLIAIIKENGDWKDKTDPQ